MSLIPIRAMSFARSALEKFPDFAHAQDALIDLTIVEIERALLVRARINIQFGIGLAPAGPFAALQERILRKRHRRFCDLRIEGCQASRSKQGTAKRARCAACGSRPASSRDSREIAVDHGRAVRRFHCGEVKPGLIAQFAAVSSPQKHDVCGDLGAGIGLEGSIAPARQPDRAEKLGPLGDFAPCKIGLLVEGIMGGDEGDDPARPDFVERFHEEISREWTSAYSEDRGARNHRMARSISQGRNSRRASAMFRSPRSGYRSRGTRLCDPPRDRVEFGSAPRHIIANLVGREADEMADACRSARGRGRL